MPTIEHLVISRGHRYVGRYGKEPLPHEEEQVDSIECIEGRGIEGDRYFDHKKNFKGQITFISAEVLDDVGQHLETDPDPVACRRNVSVRGIELNDLIGKEFTLQGIHFSGSEHCKPCFWMEEALGPGAEKQLKGRGGLRGRIHSSGTLILGDAPLEIVHS